jgi:signal transduction histidine kinase
MRRRLLVSYLTITAFVLIVLAVPLGLTYANSEQRNLISDVQQDAFRLASQAEETFKSVPADRAQSELQTIAVGYARDHGGDAVIVDNLGVVLADSKQGRALGRDYSKEPDVEVALGGIGARGTGHSQALGHDIVYVSLPIGSTREVRGAVRVTYPTSVIHDRIVHDWLLLGVTAGAVLGIVGLVSLLLARSVTRPLAQLEHAAARLGAGDLSVRADVPDDPNELRSLANSFNQTAARLQQLVHAQQAFVADASHQLRTPLAALRLRLENIEAHMVGEVADDLDGALVEVRRLSNLVDGLLALARAGHGGSAPVEVDVRVLLDGRADAWNAFASERHVHVAADVEGSVVALVTAGHLEQVVDNLLNNALEVAPAGSTVRLIAATRNRWVELRVADEGPGMSREEKARAFDRFWQSGDARRDGRAAGHFGLGLPIVRQLVVADGGEVALADSRGGGLEVRVRLRAAPLDARRPRQLSSATFG